MGKVLNSIGYALVSAVHPRMLALALLPLLAAVVLWGGLAWLFWDAWLDTLQRWVDLTPLHGILQRWHLQVVSGYLLGWGMLLVLVPITALIVAALVAMPVVAGFVAARSYPELALQGDGSVGGNIANTLVALLVYAVLWLVTLPLWLSAVLALAVPVLTSAYLVQRLFRYDALSAHATRDEYRRIVARARWRLYLLGALLAPVNHVPLAGLFAPVFIGLAFTHLCLTELRELRGAR